MTEEQAERLLKILSKIAEQLETSNDRIDSLETKLANKLADIYDILDSKLP